MCGGTQTSEEILSVCKAAFKQINITETGMERSYIIANKKRIAAAAAVPTCIRLVCTGFVTEDELIVSCEDLFKQHVHLSRGELKLSFPLSLAS